MRFDAVLSESQAQVPEQAAAFEGQGYGGLAATELTHDPFVTALLALRATTRVQVGTQIAVAFARSPMTVAVTARDLADLSGGRFVLGLGTQIEAHVTRRFSMPWSPPAARMREFVAALRAIWASWETGDRLAFRGEHYRHTLMTPAFSPGPAPSGPPPVHLAAVGPLLAQTAGAVADGVIAHVFSTRRFLQQSLLPAVTRGLEEAERDRSAFTVTVPVFVISGATPELRAAADRRVRERIAFYGSTPAYRGVLEAEGRADTADALHTLSVSRDSDRWIAMGRLIDDDLVQAFAIVEDDPLAVPGRIRQRYGDLADRVVVEPPEGADPVAWSAAIAAAGA
ncbi:TIGR03617 family F420-dependent LLM class oxidoreductase [uncultured Amnibacterium sp.]|uniref:TIGR03617 family F420-dependent LLM class oxidoreductase n=1 Tax=uncultured Amnibacterium sp. TaxID=1631851 RepID=UPI0035CC2486